MTRHRIFVLAFVFLPAICTALKAAGPASFLNFETAPVHPIALGPDGQTLAVCNLPDYRVELFDVSTGVPRRIGDVPVGVDPVSLRWRTTNELWVVNHISSSVNVVDVGRRLIMATLPTKAGPSDVVFAGNPSRAYVSCSREDVVQVFDPLTRQSVTNLPIKGDRPKAMAVSPDGSRVYVAIFESGNASTILAPKLTRLDIVPPPSVLADAEGPYHGQDPPPNHGSGFVPPLAPYLDSNTFSRGSLTVKKNADGRWMDDNNGDWTEFVSGAKAARSGRVTGWDMPDRDLAVIDTSTHAVTYATGLMNLCMTLAVNPANGLIAVVGTDGINEVRFEPVLRGVFLRVNVAMVNPESLTKTVRDLNPHLDYAVPSIPMSERAQSLGDPRGITWNSAGTRAYVTGMGSGNLVVLDADGRRVADAAVDLGEGPTGLALDEARGRLYVLNRFSASVSVVDATSLAVVTNVAFFDPTPSFIKAGRRHFYDTRRTSSLGCVSCASCHPDGRLDRLAWDLGIPNGEMFNTIEGVVANYFHPMKGPMVTRSLQSPVPEGQGKNFMHWRGDRKTVADFHVTFPDLLAADRTPSVTEMRELDRFLATIAFPPNRFRSLDNRFPEAVPLPGFFGINTNGGPPPPLPVGNAVRGFELFTRAPSQDLPEIRRNSCANCHDCESGKGVEIFRVMAPRSDGFTFMGAPLRGLDDKLGFDLQSTESRAGFGFIHDGRTDTLTRFLVEGFEFQDNQEIADLTAFLLCFSGGEMLDCQSDSLHIVPDGPAATGKQVTLTAPAANPDLAQLLAATQRSGLVRDYRTGTIKPSEFVVSGRKNGVSRTWWRDLAGQFFSDRNGDPVEEMEDLVALASPENPLTFTAVPYGSGRRLGIDRDDDGLYDRTEIEGGSDPFDVRSPGVTPPQEVEDFYARFNAVGYPGQRLEVPLDSGGRTRFSVFGPFHPNNTVSFEFIDPAQVPAGVTLSEGGTRLVWDVPATQSLNYWAIGLRALDNARPSPGYADLVIALWPPNPLRVKINPYPSSKPHTNDVELSWEPLIGHARYEIQTADSPQGPWKISGSIHESIWLDRSPALGRTNRFYRVLGVPN